jgi:hypothetical protein
VNVEEQTPLDGTDLVQHFEKILAAGSGLARARRAAPPKTDAQRTATSKRRADRRRKKLARRRNRR